MSRGEKGIYVFYLAAAITAAALYAEWRNRRWAVRMTIAAGIAGVAALSCGIWIADAGGKIRHSELRPDAHEKSP